MSMRTTLLHTARAAARQAAPRAQQVASRRAASTEHKTSSNTPWAIGSAAVFGSLAAFILMPAGDKAAHHVHDNIDAKGAGAHVADGASTPEHETEEHANARDLVRKERASGERESEQEDPKGKMVHAGEARPRTEIPSKRDDEKPMRRGASTGDKFDGTIDGDHMKAGIANEGTQPEGQEKKEVEQTKAKMESGKGSDKGSSSTPDNVDDSDKPSDKEIKDSIKQAERSNSPLATMQEEEDEQK